MSEIIILRGIPGSGKSTYAREHFSGAVVVSADDYFATTGEFAFDPEKLQQAHEHSFREFIQAVLRGEPTIVVDNTNIELFEISPYMLAGRTFGYAPKIVTLVCDAATAIARGIHDVPAEKVRWKADRLLQVHIPKIWPHHTMQT